MTKKLKGPLTDLNDPTNRDTVPAMLTPGEFVVNKEAAALFGPQLEMMNAKGLQQRQAENDAITGVQNRFLGGWIDKIPAVSDRLGDPTLIPRAIEGIHEISPYILSNYSPGGHPSESYQKPYTDKIVRDLPSGDVNTIDETIDTNVEVPSDLEGGVGQGIHNIPTEPTIVPNPKLDVEKKRGDYGANVSKSQLIDRDRGILEQAYKKAMEDGRYDAAIKIKKQLEKGQKKQEDLKVDIDAFETEYHQAEKVEKSNKAIKDNQKLEELKKVTTDSNELAKIDKKIEENNKAIIDNEGGVANFNIPEEKKVVPEVDTHDAELADLTGNEDVDKSIETVKNNSKTNEDGSITVGNQTFSAEGITNLAKQAGEFFGIEKSDFSKFLLGYLGSRLTGYDHAASMRFGGKLGLANIQAREQQEAKIAVEQAKLANKGLDLDKDIKVFDVDGTKRNAQWSKTHQRYVYTDADGKTKYIPTNATELKKGDNTLKIQESFTKTTESAVKSINTGLKDTDFNYVAVDPKEMSDVGIKFYSGLMKDYPRSEANSVYVRDSIKNAMRQFVKDTKFAKENDLPAPQDLEAYLNKATIQFRTGVSQNDVLGTNVNQLTELDDLFRNDATGNDGKFNVQEYKDNWADAKKLHLELKRNHKDIYEKWAPADYKEAMKEKDPKKKDKLLRAVQWNPMTYFAWLAETGNEDFLRDIKPASDKIFK